MMKYQATVWTGNGYNMKCLGQIAAATFSSLKAKASRLCNGYFNIMDRMEVTYHGEMVTTEITVAFHRYNRKFPNNTIIRDQWR